MKLNELLEVIVRWMIESPDAYQQVRSWRIDFADWPQDIPRQAAETYEAHRIAKGHVYAAIKTEAQFGRLLNTKLDRANLGAIQALYIEAVNQATALEMGRALIKAPENATEIVKAFKFLSTVGEPVHFGTNLDDSFARLVMQFDKGESSVLLPGWTRLSDSIGGFNPGRVGLLVAKTGFGKTNFAASLALDASEKLSTLFVNMEMLTDDFMQKLIMGAAGVTYRELKKDPRNPTVVEKVGKAAESHVARRLFFTDGQTLAVEDLAELARSFKANHDLSLMIVDYDQKIKVQTNRETPEWKALQIAVETLEVIAKKYKIYCLLLAQEAGDEKGERGRVSGSRRSTFPASTVLNFYRDEGAEGQPYIVEATKNRFGPRGAKIEVHYHPETSRVTEKGYVEEQKFGGPNVLRTLTRKSKGAERAGWNPSSD